MHWIVSKMKLFCTLVILLHDWRIVNAFLFRPSLQPIAETTNWNAPWLEYAHDPERFKPDRPRKTEEGVDMPPAYATADFREPEKPRLISKHYFYKELHRPYRLSPHYKTVSNYAYYNPDEDIEYAGCYCTTVYKRLTPLAGCALITTRHILTTATSTWLVLRDRRHFQVLEDILGAWYDTNHDAYNSSMYISPARIHFHPQWHYPEQVNRSHPFSFTFDLSVWALTHTVHGWYFIGTSATVCMRSTSVPSWWEGPTPRYGHKLRFLIVGFQMMWGYNRIPDPFHKYVIRTDRIEEPCPKTEWGWFICIPAMDFAKFGIESGAALHRSDTTWRHNGLIAMGAFSMQLRSVHMVHYFTIIDCHPVLDFLYDAYESNLQYVWLDERFEDSKHMAPVLKPGFYLEKRTYLGHQAQYDPIHID